jgi:hypothetical protein
VDIVNAGCLGGNVCLDQHVGIGVETDDFLEQSGQSQCQDPRTTPGVEQPASSI